MTQDLSKNLSDLEIKYRQQIENKPWNFINRQNFYETKETIVQVQ